MWQNELEIRGGGGGKERQPRSLPGRVQRTQKMFCCFRTHNPNRGTSRPNGRCCVNLRAGTWPPQGISAAGAPNGGAVKSEVSPARWGDCGSRRPFFGPLPPRGLWSVHRAAGPPAILRTGRLAGQSQMGSPDTKAFSQTLCLPGAALQALQRCPPALISSARSARVSSGPR